MADCDSNCNDCGDANVDGVHQLMDNTMEEIKAISKEVSDVVSDVSARVNLVLSHKCNGCDHEHLSPEDVKKIYLQPLVDHISNCTDETCKTKHAELEKKKAELEEKINKYQRLHDKCHPKAHKKEEAIAAVSYDDL